jgi:hypothetical protein
MYNYPYCQEEKLTVLKKRNKITSRRRLRRALLEKNHAKGAEAQRTQREERVKVPAFLPFTSSFVFI